MTTEAELITGCLLHDRTAQRLLYDRYKNAMYTLAYRITGDYDDANDVLQDAFMEVFSHLDQFRGEATLGAWIKQIIVRKSTRKKRIVVWQNAEEETGESIDWVKMRLMSHICRQPFWRYRTVSGRFLCWLKLKVTHTGK